MKLHRLTVRDFRGIREMCIEPLPIGVTIVEGPNESGKSSIVDALHLLLDDSIKASSTSSRVRESQPADRDVGSEVEAELELGDYRLTYFKRYNRRAETLLTISEPRRDQLAGDDAHERFKALFTQHCDRGLWEMMRVQQASELAQAQLGSAGALRNALEAAAGNEAVDEQAHAALIEQVKREHERYYTLRAKHETGELAQARKAEEAARTAATELQQRVEELESLTLGIEDLESQLRRLDDALGPARDSLNACEREIADLEGIEAAVRDCESDVARTTATLSAIQMQSDQRSQAQQRAERLEKEVAELEAQLEPLKLRFDDAQRHLTDATDARRGAEEAVKRAAEVRERAKDDELLIRTEFELGQEEQRLAKALSIREERAANKERLAAIRVDLETLQRLRALNVQVEAARLQAREGAPRVSIETHADVSVSANGESLALRPGEPHQLLAEKELTVRLDKLATISVTPPPAADELAGRLREATRALETALHQAGAGTLAEAEALYAERVEIDRAIKETPERVKQLLQDLPNISALQEKRDREAERARVLRKELPEGYQLPGSISEAEERLRQADAQERQGKTALTELQVAYEAARDEHDRARSERDGVMSKLSVLKPQYEDAERQLTETRASLSDDDAAAALREAKEAVAAATTRRDMERARLDGMEPAEIRKRAVAAQNQAERLERQVQEVREQLAGKRGVLQSQSSDGLFERAEDAAAVHEHAKRKLEAVERQAQAARLLWDTLESARADAHRRYAGPLAAKIREFGEVLYGDGFDVELGDDLTILRRTLNGLTLDFGRLSGGAKEQLSLLARLATAALVDPKDGVPLIIDDALGYTDPDRLKLMGEVLALAGQHCQVIVLTCYPNRYEHVGGARILRMEGGGGRVLHSEPAFSA